MKQILVPGCERVPAGKTVQNGYTVKGTCKAPVEPGFYSLYELADDANIHIGWKWIKVK